MPLFDTDRPPYEHTTLLVVNRDCTIRPYSSSQDVKFGLTVEAIVINSSLLNRHPLSGAACSECVRLGQAYIEYYSGA